MNLILFVLSTIGMTHIIVDGSIMQWFRDLMKNLAVKLKVPIIGSVVDCYLCCGTWCGFLMGHTWITSVASESLTLTHDLLQVFACGCAGGFLASFAAVLLNWIESATIVNLPSNHDEH